tara:strand:- start:78 stop:1763 length:1686 start_codon:yes stop_codon:yes gene_type:complete
MTVNNKRAWIITALIYWGVSAVVLLSSYHGLSQEADGTNCASGVVGLCTPGTFESSTETVTETTQTDGTGTTTTTTTTTDTTTTTVTVPETGDLLTDAKVKAMGRNQKFGGDMTSDWGGQGSAGIRNGTTCGGLGTDKCAEITGSGNNTSTLGQTGMGSTYIQTINMTHASIDPNIERGGQVPWSIRVEKRDASDSIHFRIQKSDGTTSTLLGTETLSAAGANAITNTLFQGNFSFSGAITSLAIEVSGRDINLAIGPLFDDVTVNVIYNVVNTIVTQTITTIEEFVALGTFDQETIDVATDIFENNNVVETNTGLSIEPIAEETTETSYASVAAEINTEMVAPELQAPTIEVSVPEPQTVEVQVETQSVETEMQTEMNNDITDEVAPTGGVASNEDSPQEGGGSVSSGEQKSEPEPEPTETAEAEPEEEPQSGPSSVEKKEPEAKTEQPKKVAEKKTEKPKTKTEKKQEAKQKAASKIVKKMGDKGRYDDSNQLKTLVVMQVLGNTKTFFDNQAQLQDTPGFFDNRTIPDTTISDNNYSAYIMFGGSDAAHNALTESQYR